MLSFQDFEAVASVRFQEFAAVSAGRAGFGVPLCESVVVVDTHPHTPQLHLQRLHPRICCLHKCLADTLDPIYPLIGCSRPSGMKKDPVM